MQLLVYLLLMFLVPLGMILYLSIIYNILDWRKVLYFSVFVLAVFVYVIQNIYLLVILAIGLTFVIYMDRGSKVHFPFKIMVTGLLLFWGIIVALNEIGIIEMSTVDVFVRFWPVIPLIISLYYIYIRNEYESGAVLLQFSFIFGVANLLFYMGDEVLEGRTPGSFFFVLVLIFPLIFLYILFDIFRQWKAFDKQNYSSTLMSKTITGDKWKPENTSIMTLMGRIKIKLDKKDLLFENTRKKSLRFNLITILGKIVLIIPENTVITTDNRKIAERAKRAGFDVNIDESKKIPVEDLTRLLLHTRKILGTIEIKKDNN